MRDYFDFAAERNDPDHPGAGIRPPGHAAVIDDPFAVADGSSSDEPTRGDSDRERAPGPVEQPERPSARSSQHPDALPAPRAVRAPRQNRSVEPSADPLEAPREIIELPSRPPDSSAADADHHAPRAAQATDPRPPELPVPPLVPHPPARPATEHTEPVAQLAPDRPVAEAAAEPTRAEPGRSQPPLPQETKPPAPPASPQPIDPQARADAVMREVLQPTPSPPRPAADPVQQRVPEVVIENLTVEIVEPPAESAPTPTPARVPRAGGRLSRRPLPSTVWGR